MFRIDSLVLIFCSIGFVVIGSLSALFQPREISDEEAIKLAQERAPTLALPARPVGQTVIEQTPQKICTEVPFFSGFPPKVKTRQQCDTIQVTNERFVGPTNDEERQWEAEVARIQDFNSALLELELKKIELERAQDLRALLKDLIQIGSGALGMLFGGIGTVLAIRRDRRDTRPTTPETVEVSQSGARPNN